MANFNNFIISNGFLDLNINGTFHTWSKNSATHPQMSRIDRILINNLWDSMLSKAYVKALPHTTSDHVPILLDLVGGAFGQSLFHFDLMWLENSFIRYEVLLVWQNSIVQGWG
ncbi:hypothetical protein AMTRI_Chr12g234700 [Amborella trichopoda]